MLASAVVVFLVQGAAQRQQGVFVGFPAGQGDHLGFADRCQQVRRQYLGDAFQRVLRRRDHLALDRTGPVEAMHHLRRHVHHAGRLGLNAVTVEQHFTAAALQVQQLQQALVTVRGDLPVVGTGAFGNRLHMQRLVPHRLCSLTVQGVIGDLVHGVVIVLIGTRLLCHSR
jgi:hypothetical protein